MTAYVGFVFIFFLPHLISRVIITRKLPKTINFYHIVFYVFSSLIFFGVLHAHNILPLISNLGRYTLFIFGFLPYLFFDSVIFIKIAKPKLDLQSHEMNNKITIFIITSLVIYILEVIGFFALAIFVLSSGF